MTAKQDSQWHKVNKLGYNDEMTRYMRFILALCFAAFMILIGSIAQPSHVYAQRYNAQSTQGYDISLHHLRGLISRKQLLDLRRSIEGNRRYARLPDLPAGHNFAHVMFEKRPVEKSIQRRVEALTHGMIVDIPPEYDHYGYKIRQLMARVEELPIYLDDNRLDQEFKNIRKAQIVMTYWQKAIDKERTEIEAYLATKRFCIN